MNRILLTALVLLVLPEFDFVSGQQKQAAPPPLTARQPEPPSPTIPSDMQRDLEKKATKQRQAELKRDTERLLKLSTELKEYVEKSNENVLSIDVIKKAEQIEKLAHSVKNKMRDGN